MLKINEIFYSLQGEGAHAGLPCVFLRFSGCNLQCPFCDTPHQQGNLMTIDSIIDKIKQYPAHWIVLTGGEPALHINHDFIELLKKATGKQIAIETNGTIKLPNNIDWVTVSPKTGIANKDIPIQVEHADEIKIVDKGQDLNQYFNLKCYTNKTLMYLQPCFIDDPQQFARNRAFTAQRVMSNPKWRISVQLHRYLQIQ